VKRSVVLLSALLSLSSLLAGCGGSPSVEQVRWELQRRFPEARFEREAHVHFGRISLGLLRGLVRMVPGKVDGQELLNEIYRLDVATYAVSSLPDLDRIQGETRFEDELARDGWSMTVRTREEDERTWLFTRGDEAGALRNLFVVTLEGGELTLVRIDGRLDRALAEAIADRPREAVRKIKHGGENEPAEAAGS
jgi:hypothetical protein